MTREVGDIERDEELGEAARPLERPDRAGWDGRAGARRVPPAGGHGRAVVGAPLHGERADAAAGGGGPADALHRDRGARAAARPAPPTAGTTGPSEPVQAAQHVDPPVVTRTSLAGFEPVPEVTATVLAETKETRQ